MKQYAGKNGLIWWNEREIERRDALVRLIVADVRSILYAINPAIQLFRVETPCLMPQEWVSAHLPHYRIDTRYALRAESTKGTYAVMESEQYKLPVCLYQMNKSFRDEKSDALRPSHLRYREFWQLEFQLFYSPDTKADYHQLVIDTLTKWGIPVQLDDKPPYSLRTTDLEIDGIEVASISTRKDFSVPVLELSFGLDRLLQKR